MQRNRNKLVVAAGAICAALAVGVPVVTAGSSSEQPAPAGQQGNVALRSVPSGSGGGSVTAATTANARPAGAGGVDDVQRASTPSASGGEGTVSAAAKSGEDAKPAPAP